VLLLAVLNPRPLVSVRLLTSRSPALPLGVWLAAGGAGGALLSGSATALALRQGRRRLRGRSPAAPEDAREPWFAPTWPIGRGTTASEAEGPPRPAAAREDWPQAGPERGPGEPPPTVSVPFRVLRRPQRSSSSVPGGPRAAPSATSSPPEREEAAAGVERQGADDWNSVDDENW